VHEHGEPGAALHLDDVDPLGDGILGDDEVVIDVHACALNFADALLCTDGYQEHPPLPFAPGLEVAGIVSAAGATAAHTVGTRVAGSPLLPHGGLAQQCVAKADHVFAIPPGVDSAVAAAMHVTYQTAWFALHRRAHLQAGNTLLVHAGAGGVGSAAIQLGVAAGATVVATAGGPEKVERCRALGAHHAIDYRASDFADAVNDLTAGRGADVIFDSVGGDTFVRSTKCVAWEGRIVVIGAAGGRYAEARTNHALVKNYGILGLNWRGYLTRDAAAVREANDALMALLAAGAVTPLISETLALDDDIPAAIDRITTGKTTGKIVVLP
jgi:NADPH2:quinone reductase